MALGFGLLRLSPNHFWMMTLPEIRAAFLIYAPRPNVLPRERLHALMRAFPDKS
ncbi:hypothetical protein GCM10010136_15000 [Limoniibacter endophyticus]|uniref:Phage tail assembly chaperone n=1 Tax=Limoniibacter endophyticus TaxID=1565040 RepID=A0A8J3GI05_9HYPH|nr:hypothetical protein GCM10010136_15000 [Limoniibacter endophyticus]